MTTKLEQFHQNLLGANPDKPYKLKEVHRKLYTAFDNDKHGYVLSVSAPRENTEKFLATFVMALYQTTVPTPDKVSIIVAPSIERWAVGQIKIIVRYFFSLRKGKFSREDIEPLKQAVSRLDLGSRVQHVPEGPPRWVAFGYHNKDILPPWMRGKLIK